MVFWINMLPELTNGATIWTRSQDLTFHLAYSYPKKKGVAGGGGGGGKKTDLFHKSTNQRSLHVAVRLDCTVLRSTIKTSQLPIDIRLFLRILFCFAVPLGSIPEIPAETCKEIKASELGQAVSGDYWFDSVLPGKIILLPCNMETEGQWLNFRVIEVISGYVHTAKRFSCRRKKLSGIMWPATAPGTGISRSYASNMVQSERLAERVWARGFGALVACRYVFIDIFKFKCTNHFFFSYSMFKFAMFILIVFNIVNLGLYLIEFLKFNSSCLFLLVLNILIMIEGH